MAWENWMSVWALTCGRKRRFDRHLFSLIVCVRKQTYKTTSRILSDLLGELHTTWKPYQNRKRIKMDLSPFYIYTSIYSQMWRLIIYIYIYIYIISCQVCEETLSFLKICGCNCETFFFHKSVAIRQGLLLIRFRKEYLNPCNCVEHIHIISEELLKIHNCAHSVCIW